MHENQIEDAFKQHLSKQRMMFAPRDLVEKRLRTLMGKARYMQYLDVCDDYRAGSASIDAIYLQMQTLDEANASMSHQARITLGTGCALYEIGRKYISTGTRACELGCYTGGFTSWLADRHPECSVVGADRQQHLLGIAKRSCDLANLTYRLWDYMHPPAMSEEFDLLFSCFGIDMSRTHRGFHHSLDPYNRRCGEAYNEIRQTIDPILINWRTAAKQTGRLFTALRVPDHDAFMAVVYSAASAGWKYSYHDSCKVKVGDEVFPILCFSACANEEDPNDNDLLLWWLSNDPGRRGDPSLPDRNFTGACYDAEALLRYRGLEDRRIKLEQSRTYDDMHTMRLECGDAAGGYYRFKIATTGYCELDIRMTEDLSDLWGRITPTS